LFDKNEVIKLGLKKRNHEIELSWEQIGQQFGISGERARDITKKFALKNKIEIKEDNFEDINEPQIDIKSSILKELDKGIQKDLILTKYKISSRILDATIEDLKDDGYIIESIEGKLILCKDILVKENTYDVDWNGDKIIRFGIVSDSHFGSKFQQITHLNTMYDIYQREGINTVYHSGDVSEGENMRPGHVYECFIHGADAIEQYIIKNYPRRKDIITYFINGNHDASTIKACGHDMGIYISKQRDDMKYLGMLNAKINLTPNCILELNHPLDGGAYALSYALQKTIDAMTGGEKPNIFINGHHHKGMYLFYRNIHALEAATFEAQSAWMKGKRLAAHVGGWICEVHVDNEGHVNRFKNEFIPFYEMIKDDY
jgi:hypothetical protein